MSKEILLILIMRIQTVSELTFCRLACRFINKYVLMRFIERYLASMRSVVSFTVTCTLYKC